MLLRLQLSKPMERAQDWPSTDAAGTERRKQRRRRESANGLDVRGVANWDDRRLGLGRRWDDWRRQ